MYSNGSIWHNYRIKLTGPCSSTLRTFPIDQQRCMLFYESFTNNNDQVTLLLPPRERQTQVSLFWIDSVAPITILKGNITLPDYVLVDFTATSELRVGVPHIPPPSPPLSSILPASSTSSSPPSLSNVSTGSTFYR